MAEIRTYPDAASLARAVAEHFITLATAAIAARRRFVVALSGGSTPRATYALLATEEFATRVDWSRVQVFWGDERCLSPDHPDSNYRMAREVLLDKIPIPPGNVHRIRGELPPDQAAATYQTELEAVLGAGGRFDLILLGMGADGHTASLFPDTAALHEQTRWVVAHYVDKLRAWRVTLTPVAINAATHVTFIVSGPGKAERLQQVLAEPYQPDALPAQIIRPTDGHLLWLVDAAAPAHLSEGRDNAKRG
ncbi:MAG: 6-phosphogluconolactonase [Anaerolineae bacterium]